MVSLFFCASRPKDCEQESTLFERLDIVFYATVDDQQFFGGKLDLLIRQMDAELALDRVNWKSSRQHGAPSSAFLPS
jgi:hypothetical protein